MTKLFSYILFVFLCNSIILPQINNSISGFITDSLSSEPIGYANLVIKNTKTGTPSNNKGYYFLPINSLDKNTIVISCIGYARKEITIQLKSGEARKINIKLIPKDVQLKELSVIGDRSGRENEVDLGLQRITPNEIIYKPVGLEADLFKYIQTSSGVTSTGDVTAKYYVRGGNTDQNLVLLERATIYNPFHALGILSVIDPEIISMVDFYKGGFSTEFSGRLSSVLDITTKEGNKNRYSASGQVSLLSAKLSLEGPIPNGSLIVTGRKSYYTKILKNYLNKKEAPFDFYDLFFKANYSNPDLFGEGRLIAFGFLSNDELKYNDPSKEDFIIGNNILGLSWNHIWQDQLFSNFSISNSRFNAEVIPNFSNSKPRENYLNDFSANFHFTYLYDSKDELRFGLETKFLSTKLKLINLFGNNIDFNQSGWDFSPFMNYKFFRWENIGLDIGVRAKLNGLSAKRPFLFEPRINFTYKPIPIISLKASLGRYSQEVSTLTNDNELITIFEPWIITPSYLSASEATHYIVGLQYYFSEELDLDIEAYYKSITNLIESNPKKVSSNTNDFINVDGESYGTEILMNYKSEYVYSKVAYSLGWAYKFLNNTKYYPRYDVRHSLNISLDLNLGKGWLFSSMWIFRTGMPTTPISGFYDRLQSQDEFPFYIFNNFTPSTLWGEKNSYRLPVYHRLDLSLFKKFDLNFMRITIGVSVINVYDRKNIFYLDKETGEKIYMLPFLPSANIKVEL